MSKGTVVYNEDAIQSIREDRDRVRKRPTLYIPSTDAKGAVHIIFEIVDNAVDELTRRGAVGHTTTLRFDEKTKVVTVEDDGAGIPHKSLIDTCTVINTSGKFDNSENSVYQWSGGTNGIGLKLAVFMSEWCDVASTRQGKTFIAHFVDGKLKNTELLDAPKKSHGTVIRYKTSQKYVDINAVTPEMIQNRCQEKSRLFPDIMMYLEITDKSGKTNKITYHGRGIHDMVEEMNPSTTIVDLESDQYVRILKNLTDDNPSDVHVRVRASFALTEKALDADRDAYIVSYCNTIKTYSGGTNVDGLKDGLVKFFNKNIVPNFGKRDQDLHVLPSDIYAGLCGVVVAMVHVPEFEGQHKDRINNPEIKFAVRDAVCEALEKQKPQVIKEIADFIKRVARGRMASKKVRTKDVTSAFSKDRNKKLYDMIWNSKTTHPELIIVEGETKWNCPYLFIQPVTGVIGING